MLKTQNKSLAFFRSIEHRFSASVQTETEQFYTLTAATIDSPLETLRERADLIRSH